MSRSRLLIALVVLVFLAGAGLAVSQHVRGSSTPSHHVTEMRTGAPSAAPSTPRLKTFAGRGLAFTYPAGWYAGVEEDTNGWIGGSAGVDELLTFLSDGPFEPLCTTVRSGGGSSTTVIGGSFGPCTAPDSQRAMPRRHLRHLR